jgi:mono/diheme cytochrome c family protein
MAIELVDWQRTYGVALGSPDGATDAARRGAALFGESCIVCHRMRGTGGERGPDLTQVASRMSERTFAAMLPGHPGWRERAAPSPDAVEETWAFFRAVAASPGPSPLEPVLDEPADRPNPPPPFKP